MANNHMGDVDHGVLIVKEFGKLIKKYPEFNFSMKLQYRDNSFFHPDHIDRKDHKLIKRFTETRLTDAEFKRIIDEIHAQGFISMCTPWDSVGVDYQGNMGVQIIKIASCAFTDWPLLEKIAQKDLPIIASTAGATEDDIKNVYTFLKNRNKEFAILHCVGEYPCINEQIPSVLAETVNLKGQVLVEVLVAPDEDVRPRVGAKSVNGKMVSGNMSDYK